jgi:hypothetical protein
VHPNNARPKGRTIKTSEQRVVKLGAKGEKKKTRKCQKCGIADGHNSRTCLFVDENRVKLHSLADRKRGRSPRSRKKNSTMAPQWNKTSTSKKHKLVDSREHGSDDDISTNEKIEHTTTETTVICRYEIHNYIIYLQILNSV